MIFRNQLLTALPASIVDILRLHFSEITLPLGRVLCEPGDRLAHVYFPSSGVVSVVTVMGDGRLVESITVGREGAVGILEAIGDGVCDARYVVQIAGSGLRIDRQHLRSAADAHPAAKDLIVRYAQAALNLVQQNAACNAIHPIQARLCKWLLSCQDRVGDDVVPITQEFLAAMLGVQRTTVNSAAKAIQAKSLIDYRRGRIQILDRQALERSSCECYAQTQHVFDRLLGEHPAMPIE